MHRAHGVWFRFSWFLPVAVVLANLVYVSPARATNFNVSNANDAGGGSLRQAIIDMNADAATSHTITITANALATVLTTGSLPSIDTDITDVTFIFNPGVTSYSVTNTTAGQFVFRNTGGTTNIRFGDGTNAAAVMTVNGRNVYTGGSRVNASSFEGAAGPSSASIRNSIQGAFVLQNDGVLIFNQRVPGPAGAPINGTYSGDAGLNGISGTGSVIKRGTGTLTFTTGLTNSYTGGTSIEEGILIGDTDSIPAGTGFFTGIDISTNARVVFDQGFNASYDGFIQGGGIFEKRGTGELTLTALNSLGFGNFYSGGTIITAGTLIGTSDTIPSFGPIQNNSPAAVGLVFDQAFDGEVFANISGTGQLTKRGTGRVDLTGINSYQGGTHVEGGILGGTTRSLQGAFDLDGGTTLIIDQTLDGGAFNGIFIGTITGAGSVVKDGPGVVVLQGTNSYTGGTTVNLGTLQGDTNSLQGDIVNNSALIFNQAFDGTYAGAISSTGTVNKQGAGTVTFTGANTYSGLTTIEAGTLQGDTTSLQGANNTRQILNNAVLSFNQAFDGSYTGVISGLGSVSKLGTGKVTLTNANTYTGATNILNGTLEVNGSITSFVNVQAAGRLQGTGSVGGISNSGTLAPGNSIGTLTANGNYSNNPSGVFEVEVKDDGSTDLLQVNGSVSLNGGTVNVIDIDAGAGNFQLGQTFTFITSSGPVTGTFSGTTGTLSGFTPSLIYNPNSVQIILFNSPTNFAQNPALTPNQSSVATALDSLNNLASGGTLAFLQGLGTLSGADLQFALNRLGGSVYGSLYSAELQQSQYYLWMTAERIRKLQQAGEPGISTAMNQGTANSPIVMASYKQSSGSLDSLITPTAYGSGTSLGAWGIGYGFGGHIDGDRFGNAQGADFRYSGTTLGVDVFLDEHTIVGATGGFGPGRLTSMGGLDRIDVDTINVGGYAGYTAGINNLLGVAVYGNNSNASARRLSFDGFDMTAVGNFNDYLVASYLEDYLDLWWGGVNFQPFVSAQYINLNRNSFNETGAGPANLSVGSSSVDSFRGSVGGRIRDPMQIGAMTLTPEIRGRWIRAFKGEDTIVNAQFIGSPVFNTTGAGVEKDIYLLGAGLSLNVGDNISVFANYDAQFSNTLDSHFGFGGVQIAW